MSWFNILLICIIPLGPAFVTSLSNLDHSTLETVASHLSSVHDLSNFRLVSRATRNALNVNAFRTLMMRDIVKHVTSCRDHLFHREIHNLTMGFDSYDPLEMVKSVTKLVARLEDDLLVRADSETGGGRRQWHHQQVQRIYSAEALNHLDETEWLLDNRSPKVALFGQLLVWRCDLVVSAYKQFLRENPDRNRYFYHQRGVRVTVASFFYNIFGNVPLCVRLKRLSLAKKKMPKFSVLHSDLFALIGSYLQPPNNRQQRNRRLLLVLEKGQFEEKFISNESNFTKKFLEWPESLDIVADQYPQSKALKEHQGIRILLALKKVLEALMISILIVAVMFDMQCSDMLIRLSCYLAVYIVAPTQILARILKKRLRLDERSRQMAADQLNNRLMMT